MNKFYAVALFYSVQEIGIESSKEPFIYHRTVVFKNRTEQIQYYANTMCPASQMLEADTEEELKEKIQQLCNNFKDNAWLEKNIYPYL